jgi:hypothetical protein
MVSLNAERLSAEGEKTMIQQRRQKPLAETAMIVTAIACAFGSVVTAGSEGAGWFVVPLGLAGLLFGTLFGSVLFPLSGMLIPRQARSLRGWIYVLARILLPIPIVLLAILTSIYATAWCVDKWLR